MYDRTLDLTYKEDAYLFFTSNYDLLFKEVED